MPTASRAQFTSTVQHNHKLCREHYRLTLSLESFTPTRAGQFVQLACRDLELDPFEPREIELSVDRRLSLESDELSGPTALLRRPFSLAGRRDLTGGGVELDFIHRVVGVATSWLSELAPGDRVSLIGPLGNCFTLPRPDQTALLVGGGVGIPPMLYLAEALRGRGAIAFAGALTHDLLPLTITSEPDRSARPTDCIEEFATHGIRSVIATDDGSLGYEGYVTQALEHYLDSSDAPAPTQIAVYSCGPELMMKRVADIAMSRGIECQVAAERAMACGMGTCQSCCIRHRKPDPNKPPLIGKDWSYKLTCTDGPVFWARELLW
jgi:dihydroorotate dehydrogenase electron transfer subunit